MNTGICALDQCYVMKTKSGEHALRICKGDVVNWTIAMGPENSRWQGVSQERADELEAELMRMLGVADE